MTLSLQGRYLTIDSGYDPALIAIIKATDGRIYRPEGRQWLLPLSNPSTQGFVATIARMGLPVAYLGCTSQEIDDRLREMVVARAYLEKAAVADDALGDTVAYPFQRVGIRFMKSALQLYGGVLNACEPSLGKTMQTILTAKEMGVQTMLVVTPKSVCLQWRDELRKFDPDISIVVAMGTKAQRLELYREVKRLVDSGNRVALILGYETLRIDREIVPKLQLACYDEIHRLGNRSSKITKVAQQFPSEYKIGLSATPLRNSLPELHSIMSVISPGFLGSWQQYLERYCEVNYWNAVVGGKNIEELKQRCSTIVFRRTLEEVNLDLPPVIYQTIPVVLSEKERSLYERCKAELVFELEHSEISKLSSAMALQNTLTKLGKLCEIADSLELIGDSTESSKTEALKDFLKDVLLSGKKAIIFSRFERYVDILIRELAEHNPVYIVGRRTPAQRNEAVRRFTHDEDCRLIIGTAAMSEGLSLPSASICINADLPFSVSAYIQRIGRSTGLRRKGQKDPLLVVNMVAEKTIEQHVQKLLASKIGLAKELLETEEVFTTLDQVKAVLSHSA